MNLIKNYIIKPKIKIITLSAIIIVISMLISLILFSGYSQNTLIHSIPNTSSFLFTSLLILFIFFGYLLYSTIQNSIVLLKYKLETNIQVKNELLKEKTKYLEQYQYMIDESEAVIQFDMFGNIIDTNEHYCNLSQYTKEELIGQPIVNFLNTKNQDHEFYEEITNIIKEGKVYKGINSDLSKNGDTFTTKTVILPILNKDDLIEYFFCIRTDISELTALTDEIIATQKDIISTMGEIGESRSKETGLHVKRVAEYSKLLATKYGLSKEECELIYNASPMHDIGKVAIPDEILKKPGKLTPKEFEIMKTHSKLGYDMLKNSKREILATAAIIAHEHHEKFDGTGYPNNKKGEEIHIYGRITAIADIFDALGSNRCYKRAWSLEDIKKLLINGKGVEFDPILVNLFLVHIDEFLVIRDRLEDKIEFTLE